MLWVSNFMNSYGSKMPTIKATFTTISEPTQNSCSSFVQSTEQTFTILMDIMYVYKRRSLKILHYHTRDCIIRQKEESRNAIHADVHTPFAELYP